MIFLISFFQEKIDFFFKKPLPRASSIALGKEIFYFFKKPLLRVSPRQKKFYDF